MAAGIPLPSMYENPIKLADWLELTALTAPDGNASSGDLERGLNRLSAGDVESICTACMTELQCRADAAQNGYPFKFTGTLLKIKGEWQDYTPYVFCLLLSHSVQGIKRISRFMPAMMFEELSGIAVSNYIRGEFLRFGSPRTDLPKPFRDALVEVSGKVKEWNPACHKALGRKDGGLDIVAWKHFADEKTGKLIIFGQCASGADWEAKVPELQPTAFCSAWLGGIKSPIVKTFFIPHRLSNEMFEYHVFYAKLFFDRCRIAQWAPNGAFLERTSGNSVSWCKLMLEKVPQ